MLIRIVTITLLATSCAASTHPARTPATGAIQGAVTEGHTGDKLAGVTVIATATELAQSQSAITNDRGSYKISDLPAGECVVTFHDGMMAAHRTVYVRQGKVTPVFQTLTNTTAGNTVIHVHDTAPTIGAIPEAMPLPRLCVYFQNCWI